MEDDHDFDFELNDWFDNSDECMFTEEDAEAERQSMLQCCGSCESFIPLMAEAGLCKLNENNCLCKNPKAFIDMFDPKCSNWKENINY